MPFPTEHACRLHEPSRYREFRRVEREHEGKTYGVIRGHLKDEDEWEDQSYRYPKDEWTEEEARQHCREHKGQLFEPASDEEDDDARSHLPTLIEGVREHVWALTPRYAAAVMRSVRDGRVDPILRVQPRSVEHRGQGVALVPMMGMLTYRHDCYGMGVSAFITLMRRLADDAEVGTIVIDCDSPGGMVDGIPEAWKAVMDARKTTRVIAVANTLMASGAYWICSAAHEIVAPQIAEIGSIGVFRMHVDLSTMLERAGVKVTMIRKPPTKAEGNSFEALSEEALAHYQEQIDDVYALFVKQVAKGRNTTTTVVDKTYGKGRTLLTAAALDVGMIDRIGTLDSVLAELLPHGAESMPLTPHGVEERAATCAESLNDGAPEALVEHDETPSQAVEDETQRAAQDATAVLLALIAE